MNDWKGIMPNPRDAILNRIVKQTSPDHQAEIRAWASEMLDDTDLNAQRMLFFMHVIGVVVAEELDKRFPKGRA